MTVEVDFTCGSDEEPDQVLADMADGLGLATEVVATIGPTGQWPLGRVSGPTSDVDEFLKRHGYAQDNVRWVHE